MDLAIKNSLVTLETALSGLVGKEIRLKWALEQIGGE